MLWASLLAASAEAEAEGDEADAERFAERAAQVRGAVKRANDRMIAVAERELAYVRTGHHSKTTGEWRDAEGFIVASFEQHDSRDGLHAAPCAQRDRQPGPASGQSASDDERWRALHAHPLFRNKLRLGTLGDRFLAQELELIGFLSVLREDGKALEVGGISDEAVDEFSHPEQGTAGQGAGARMGVRAGARPRSGQAGQVGDQAAGRDEDPGLQGPQPAAGRPAGSRVGAQSGAERDRSAVRAPRSSRRRTRRSTSRAAVPSDAERARIIRKAVAATQPVNATFDRSQLTFELGQVLPPLPADVDPEEYLNGLADEALSGRAEGVNVLQVAPAPDVIDVSRLPFRKDGTSIYRAAVRGAVLHRRAPRPEQWLVECRSDPGAAAGQRGGRGRGAGRARTWTIPSGRRPRPADLRPPDQLPGGPGRDREDPRHGRVRAGLGGAAGRARHRPDGQHQRGAGHGRRGRKAGARMETFNIAQFLGKIKDSDADPRAHAGLPR